MHHTENLERRYFSNTLNYHLIETEVHASVHRPIYIEDVVLSHTNLSISDDTSNF